MLKQMDEKNNTVVRSEKDLHTIIGKTENT